MANMIDYKQNLGMLSNTTHFGDIGEIQYYEYL